MLIQGANVAVVLKGLPQVRPQGRHRTLESTCIWMMLGLLSQAQLASEDSKKVLVAQLLVDLADTLAALKSHAPGVRRRKTVDLRGQSDNPKSSPLYSQAPKTQKKTANLHASKAWQPGQDAVRWTDSDGDQLLLRLGERQWQLPCTGSFFQSMGLCSVLSLSEDAGGVLKPLAFFLVSIPFLDKFTDLSVPVTIW